MKQEHENGKTFVVSALIGHAVGTPWPFGRLHISDETVTVSTVFKGKTCLKSEITGISLQKFGPQNQLLFEDATGKMAGVTVVLSMRVEGVVGELRRRGYPVVDRRPRFLPIWRDSAPSSRP